MAEMLQILFPEGSDPSGKQPTEDRKPPGAGLGFAVILAAVFWAGVIIAIVLI